MDNNYGDIIDLPHKQSDTRSHMSVYDRAAQFAPFAALTGYDDAIFETGRETSERRTLDEYDLKLLDDKIRYLGDHLSENAPVTVTYFKPDEKKSGGEYVDLEGVIKKIDRVRRILLMQSGEEIEMDGITDLESPIIPF